MYVHMWSFGAWLHIIMCICGHIHIISEHGYVSVCAFVFTCRTFLSSIICSHWQTCLHTVCFWTLSHVSMGLYIHMTDFLIVITCWCGHASSHISRSIKCQHKVAECHMCVDMCVHMWDILSTVTCQHGHMFKFMTLGSTDTCLSKNRWYVTRVRLWGFESPC